uniref:Portal protein n=1 Tax=viral metagenome TaxID=1070528 RepID=A0A6M3L294_9ZZZZ
MITIDQIKELKTYLVDDCHNMRLEQQESYQKYIDDTFPLPLITNLDYIVRLGAAADLINGVAGQIITSNPQVFRGTIGKSKTAEQSALAVAKECNRWAMNGLTQSPQLYHEFVKNDIGLGEAWIHTFHNEMLFNWEPDDHDGKTWQEVMPDALPVKFVNMPPTIMFLDPADERDGIIRRVIISYERMAGDIQRVYPYWTKMGNRKYSDKLSFFIYWDDEIRYAEGDNEPLLREGVSKDGEPPELSNGEGIQENPYKVCPFSHAYSGFGRQSEYNNPATLAISRIHYMRNKMVEDETMRSDLFMGTHKFMHKHIDVINRSAVKLGDDAFSEYSRAAGKINILDLPPGAEFEVAESLLPDQQAFEHYRMVHAEVMTDDPPTTRGFAGGTSGRQEDILGGRGMNLYDSIVTGAEQAFAQSFGHGLKIIEELPFLMPPGLKAEDIKNNHKLTVMLKADDPIEMGRLAADGDRKQMQGIIDHETNLIEYQGKTQGEAQLIMAKQMVDEVKKNDPIIRRLVALNVAKEMGMEGEYLQLEEEMVEMGEGNTGGLSSAPKIGSQGGEPREGNIKTDRGREETDMSRERKPPRRSPM